MFRYMKLAVFVLIASLAGLGSFGVAQAAVRNDIRREHRSCAL